MICYGSDPDQVGSDPDQVGSDPDQARSDPDQARSDPDQVGSSWFFWIRICSFTSIKKRRKKRKC